ncbi:MAG: iron-sulfur cluster assembly scaffold protein [Planctomycetota bacterium]
MSGLSPILQKHFDDPKFFGRLANANRRGKSTNPACGDILEFEMCVEGERIVTTRFMAHGCSSVIAVASLMAERLQNVNVSDLLQSNVGEIVHNAGGLHASRSHAILVVERALRDALDSAEII